MTLGLSITDACARAGLSPQGWHKAVKRSAVRDYLEQVQHQFVLSADAKRVLYRAQAFEVALDLMRNAKSEAIRARMCEFLASDAKVSPVAVHIDARATSGYTYVKPAELNALPVAAEGETETE